jgi:phage gpG-like protein
MIQISVTDTGVHDEIARLIRRFDNPRPALLAIGELLVEFTKERFARSQDPYGRAWAPNAETTLRRALDRHPKNRTKSGDLSARGQRVLAGKKPLIGESKSLSTQIHSRVVPGAVEVYSSMVYARMQQFGGSKAQFPHLWGDIPARPFFPDAGYGLPPELSERVRQVLSDALAGPTA